MRMKNLKTLFVALTTVLLFFGSGTMWGGTTITYKLDTVKSVAVGSKYVFVQGDHAAIGSVNSSALQTTSTYSDKGLTGSEAYVWIIEAATGGYYIKNASLSSNAYLNNSSKTNISLGAKSSIWSFTFSDDVALIQNTSNSNRFLGYTTASSYVYKAYATSNLNDYAHEIFVLKLVEESTKTAV